MPLTKQRGEVGRVWVLKFSKKVSVGKAHWNPKLAFSVETCEFRIPQVLCLPLLTKTAGVWGDSSHFGTTAATSSRVRRRSPDSGLVGRNSASSVSCQTTLVLRIRRAAACGDAFFPAHSTFNCRLSTSPLSFPTLPQAVPK